MSKDPDKKPYHTRCLSSHLRVSGLQVFCPSSCNRSGRFPASSSTSSGLIPSSQISFRLLLTSCVLIFNTTRSGLFGFRHSQQLSPGAGTLPARSCWIELLPSIAKRPWYSVRSMASQKLTRARLVCNWKIRDLDTERSSRGSSLSGWRNGRAGGERGAEGREWVDRERVWDEDIPNGVERGPLIGAGLVVWVACVELYCCS